MFFSSLVQQGYSEGIYMSVAVPWIRLGPREVGGWKLFVVWPVVSGEV